MKVVRRQDRIDAVGGLAVFIVHDDAAAIRDLMLADIEPEPGPVVVDLERQNYERWGLIRVPWWKIWLDPRVWSQYASLLLSGERPRGVGRDTGQLGGDFVVAAGGVVVYARPQRRDARPAAGELVECLEASARGDPRSFSHGR